MQRSLFAPVCLTFALACTPAEPGGEGNGEDADTSTTDATSGTDSTDTNDTFPTTGDGDGDPVPEVLATIDGVIADMNLEPLPTPGLQFCGPVDAEGNVELCIPVQVDDTGAFAIGATKLGTWSLKVVHGPLDGRYFAGQAFQITVNDGDAYDFSSPPIVVPEVSEVVDLTGATGMTDVIIDDVLTVSLDPALSQSPDFTAPTELGGLEVASEFWRVTEIEGSPVIAAWAFTPFGVHPTEGEFGFTIGSGLGLAPGAAVTIYHIEKVNGMIHEAGTGVVNVDATGIDVTTTNGLHELSWLLVTG